MYSKCSNLLNSIQPIKNDAGDVDYLILLPHYTISDLLVGSSGRISK